MVSHRPHIDYLGSPRPQWIPWYQIDPIQITWGHLDPNGFLGIKSTPYRLLGVTSTPMDSLVSHRPLSS
ncbi:hypothetical protein T06_16413 [Trichinella sp. T6]|nr:hypothetical protein T06_16413 [Trichinella sp. T6]